MKFEGIKKGDTVFALIDVRASAYRGAHIYGEFFLPCTVDHITNTMFDVLVHRGENSVELKRRFYLKDGRERTSSYGGLKVYKLGEEVRDHRFSGVVHDQTNEYYETVRFKNKVRKLERLLAGEGICPRTVTEQQLDEAIEVINKLPLKE